MALGLGAASAAHTAAAGGEAHRCRCSLVRCCICNARKAPQASVDAIKEPAGCLPGKKIGIHFQRRGNAGRRRAFGRIPQLELTQDFFDHRGVFDKTDDA